MQFDHINFNEDKDTVKDSGIKLALTDEQASQLTLLAYRAGFKTPKDLLESFVGDLTEINHGGSDEKELASNWYNRAFGAAINTTYGFLEFLHEHTFLTEDLLESEEYFDKAFNIYINIANDKAHDDKYECLAIVKELQNRKDLQEEKIEKYIELYKSTIETYYLRYKENDKYNEDNKLFMLDSNFNRIISLIIEDVDLDQYGKFNAICSLKREYCQFLINDSFK